MLLYRRLGRLRVERSDIEAFVTAIDTASQRAEAAIAGIRESALEAQRALGGQKELAQQRIAELSRLVDSAGRMARRVETALHQGARSMAEDSARARRRAAAVSARNRQLGCAPSCAAARRAARRAEDRRRAAARARGVAVSQAATRGSTFPHCPGCCWSRGRLVARRGAPAAQDGGR